MTVSREDIKNYQYLFLVMECPACGSENPGDSKYCGSCGQKLVVYCSNCGAKHTVDNFYCGECGERLHRDQSEIINHMGQYEDKGQPHLWHESIDTAIDTILPYQGWKLHVSAYYEDAFDVCRVLLPELSKNNIPHKVMPDLETLKKSQGGKNQYKLIVIYPTVDEDKQEVCLPTYDIEGETETRHLFIRNPSSKKEFEFNETSLNCNVERTEKAADIVLERLEEHPNTSIWGGPEVHQAQSDEKSVMVNGKPTRLKYRYDKMGSNGRITRDSRWTEDTRITNKRQLKKLKRDLIKPDGIVGINGEEIADYREVNDVLQEDWCVPPFS